jgi:hypothetical protein
MTSDSNEARGPVHAPDVQGVTGCGLDAPTLNIHGDDVQIVPIGPSAMPFIEAHPRSDAEDPSWRNA